jgi:hypothetical protein
MKRTYERPTLVKAPVRLHAATASRKAPGFAGAMERRTRPELSGGRTQAVGAVAHRDPSPPRGHGSQSSPHSRHFIKCSASRQPDRRGFLYTCLAERRTFRPPLLRRERSIRLPEKVDDSEGRLQPLSLAPRHAMRVITLAGFAVPAPSW